MSESNNDRYITINSPSDESHKYADCSKRLVYFCICAIVADLIVNSVLIGLYMDFEESFTRIASIGIFLHIAGVVLLFGSHALSVESRYCFYKHSIFLFCCMFVGWMMWVVGGICSVIGFYNLCESNKSTCIHRMNLIEFLGLINAFVACILNLFAMCAYGCTD